MTFKKIIRFLSSLKLAVLVIVAIATLTAIGTFVESKYDAMAAGKWVYHSLWMNLVMGMLAVNLTAVIIDRYPWKKRHLAFICAHVGILILMLGQYLSSTFGLDASLRVGIGESNKYAVVSGQTDLILYSSFDGSNYTKLFDQPVDFFLRPPSSTAPVQFPADKSPIKITDYKRYVVPSKKVVATDRDQAGAGLRFQIHNDRVNVVEWVVQRNPKHTAVHDFGPAQVYLGEIPSAGRGKNEIYLEPMAGSETLKFAVFKKDQEKPSLKGQVSEGQVITPGWMGLELKVLRYFPRAVETWDFKERETPTPLTTAAIKVEFDGKEHWMLLNDTLKLFSDNAVYVLTYAHRRVDLGFPIYLDRFLIDRYQGTMRAAAYKSHVKIPEFGEAEISMNEPLKYKGFTIYQASFEESPGGGAPTASIFSVNQDPGRIFKYLGSLIMVLGIILLFYFKKQAQKQKSKE